MGSCHLAGGRLKTDCFGRRAAGEGRGTAGKAPEERYAPTKDRFREFGTLRERLFQAQPNATEVVGPTAAALFGAGLFPADTPPVDLEKLVFTRLAAGQFSSAPIVWAARGISRGPKLAL